MDIKNYVELKEKGIISVKKIGNKYAVSEKQWVQSTGEEDIPITTRLNIEDLQSKKTFLQKEIDAINVVIADCEALD